MVEEEALQEVVTAPQDEVIALQGEDLVAMGDARSRIMEACWSVTFLWTAGLRNFEFHLKDLGLSVMSTSQRTTTQGSLVALLLCSLWTLMKPQRLNIT